MAKGKRAVVFVKRDDEVVRFKLDDNEDGSVDLITVDEEGDMSYVIARIEAGADGELEIKLEPWPGPEMATTSAPTNALQYVRVTRGGVVL